MSPIAWSLAYFIYQCQKEENEDESDLFGNRGKRGTNCHHIIIINLVRIKSIIRGVISQFIGDRWGIHVCCLKTKAIIYVFYMSMRAI